MICTVYPKKLWDHCLDMEAFICLNTALGIYMFDGEVPENLMKIQASDISHSCEFSWYEW